jgi:uncharacterized protein (UPF0262 family)
MVQISESLSRIMALTLRDGHVIRRKIEIEQERQVALGDLLRENQFALKDAPSHGYTVELSVVDNRLVLEVVSAEGMICAPVKLAIAPFRGLIRDYFMICEQYFEALGTADPYKVEAIDMGRRAIHNEGAELLHSMMAERVEMDFPTARRLFTLMCVLHIR